MKESILPIYINERKVYSRFNGQREDMAQDKVGTTESDTK